MTLEPTFTPSLRLVDLPTEPPEIGVLAIRREIEGRIAWLAERVLSTSISSEPAALVREMVQAGALDKGLGEALATFLESTDSSERRGGMTRAEMTAIVDVGLDVAAGLDQLIALVQRRIEQVPARNRLGYRLLTLSTIDLMRLASSFGVTSEQRASRRLLARDLLAAATRAGRVEELEREVEKIHG